MRYLGGFNSPSYNPLAANVTTGANTVQQGGIYTTTSVAQANGLRQWVGDQFYGQTKALFQADNFANGSQNNTFLDSSSNNFSVTRNGNPTQGAFTPFSSPNGYWSNLFDGTGDYLIVAGNSNLAFGANDFTIECFFYATTLQGFIYDGRNTATQASPTIFFSGTTLVYFVSGANRIVSGTVLTNRWYHLVVSRVSGNTRMFLDGVQTGSTYSDSTTYVNSTNRPYIAANGTGTISGYAGYITNLRVLNGTGTIAPVVPTSALTAITNTQLLTCQSNRFLDNSSNNFAITGVADASTRLFIPFNNNSSQYSTPLIGGAIYLDGTGDYLNLGGQSQLEFGANDFTIELWLYPTALPVSPAGLFLYDSRPASTDGAYPCVFVAPTTNVLNYYVNTATRITGTTAITLNQWYHIVVSRVSGTTRMFLNGVQQGNNYNDSTSYLNGASRPVVGNNGLNLGGPVTGYISGVRAVNGSGVTTVTVPNAPATAITNTQLLLSGTNAAIVDASATSVAETVGNAQVSTVIKKYGSGSMFFDGTGDWLLVPNSPDINLSTTDFTIECWINFANAGAQRSIAGKGVAGSTGWEIYCNATPTLFIFVFGNTIQYSNNYNFNQHQWYHIAVVRSGTGIGNVKLYINGFLTLESSVAINNDLSTTSPMYVGAGRGGNTPFLGYIDDFRITKNLARYTSPFIPPATALPRASLGNL